MQAPIGNPESLLVHTLLQISLVILAARVAGRLAVSLHQPRAVGEIVAGLVLGPSVFGKLAPESFAWVFRSHDATPMTIMSQIGLIMLMFQVGMEFDFALLSDRRNRRAVVLVTLIGLLAPFGLGFAYGWGSAPELAPSVQPVAYSLFLGVAMAITAVPILGRILMEFKLTRSRLGVITIAAAGASDAIGWVLLAFISAYASQHFEPFAMAKQVGLLAAYVLVSWYVTRHLLRHTVRRFDLGSQSLPQDLLAILIVIVFGSAMLTSELGIFAIFGGFLVGVLLHDQHELVEAWNHKVADLVTVFFLPIFFTYTGLRTDVGSLETAGLWGWCALLIFLAVLGKFGGSYLASRLAGLPPADARSIAIMMNTRALMELIVVNLGYDLGVIPREVFTMLVLMAIVSTLMTAPGLRRWLPASERAG
ncbi:cation:proton antiporter [Methylococcus sp. EFPC2]|uniref:cation:proton antiporter n=1 Tax=Methylococcus sp. EFPC2 TaxID=2812648 RepID=UPI0019671A85|nr:cation:proton antiporter [Methylococcus sp. EFPC2]QSA98851.1 cation:proton antiporter [Methylococcus sp. EFPC2]